MNDSLNKQEMFEYYDERAPEYEEFYDGGHPVVLYQSEEIQKEIVALKNLIPEYISGRCIDIAAGTGYWLPLYESNCTAITLIDQSANALYESKQKIEKLGIANKTELIRSDIFEYEYDEGSYDNAFCGFLICHLTDAEIDTLLTVFKRLLSPGGKFVISDKIWTGARKTAYSDKINFVTRTLKDGRQFRIINRFFEKSDLHNLAEKHNFKLDIIYWGNIFFLIAGQSLPD